MPKIHIRLCSICHLSGHIRTNTKFHPKLSLIPPSPSPYPHSPYWQKHGKDVEYDLITNVYGVSKADAAKLISTQKIDIPAHLNKIDGIDVSVKTSKSPTSVCMADARRVFKSVFSSNPIHMVVWLYEQDGPIKKMLHIIEVDLTGAYRELFGDVEYDHIERLHNSLLEIPKGRSPTPEETAQYKSDTKELNYISGIIRFNPKCNSTNRRLQCSMSILKFIENYPERIVARSSTEDFRGRKVITNLESDSRTFAPK